MPRLSNWNNRKGQTYNFIDRSYSEFFGASGTALFVHRYMGTHNADGSPTDADVLKIQDVLFLENRDRKYSDDVIELRGLYNVSDIDFDLRQFGMFLQNDTIYIEIHTNDCIARLGRKAMAGDVLELPHQRDDAILDPDSPAINKYYVIDEVTRSSSGYSPTWFSHVLRLKCSPMAATEEFADILEKQAKDPFGFDDGRLRDILTSEGTDMGINEDIVEAARANFVRRNFETRHFYVVPGEEGPTGLQNPWVFAGDGNPPNGAELIDSGNRFPEHPNEGDYYLRVDYSPVALFRHKAGTWRMQELDYRETEWSAASRILKEFINNRGTEVHQDGTEIDIRQSIHRAIKPRADF